MDLHTGLALIFTTPAIPIDVWSKIATYEKNTKFVKIRFIQFVHCFTLLILILIWKLFSSEKPFLGQATCGDAKLFIQQNQNQKGKEGKAKLSIFILWLIKS